MKTKTNIVDKVNKMVKHGAALDRLCFFLLVMLLVSHFFGCMWIYEANAFVVDEKDLICWINASNLENLDMMELYYASFYFIM